MTVGGTTTARRGDCRAPATRHSLSRVAGFKIRRLHNRISLSWAAWFVPVGVSVTPVQGGILMVIDENPGITQVAVAQLMEVEKPTLSKALTPLVEAGLVRRDRVANDGRAAALSLTDAGAEVMDVLRREVAAHERHVLARLTAAERDQLHALLDKLDG